MDFIWRSVIWYAALPERSQRLRAVKYEKLVNYFKNSKFCIFSASQSLILSLKSHFAAAQFYMLQNIGDPCLSIHTIRTFALGLP